MAENTELKRRAAQWPVTFGQYRADYTEAVDAGIPHDEALNFADACAEMSVSRGHRITFNTMLAAARTLGYTYAQMDWKREKEDE